jgi:5,10-methylene-tetrahydrofolate dehydrogenase/methenyl tetrahydrofolate cyclohydrolase
LNKPEPGDTVFVVEKSRSFVGRILKDESMEMPTCRVCVLLVLREDENERIKAKDVVSVCMSNIKNVDSKRIHGIAPDVSIVIENGFIQSVQNTNGRVDPFFVRVDDYDENSSYLYKVTPGSSELVLEIDESNSLI